MEQTLAIFGQTQTGLTWLANCEADDAEAIMEDYKKLGQYEALMAVPVNAFWQSE